MEENEKNGEEYGSPPDQLFERLSYISGYTWDQSIKPFHSSYDNWHVFGIQQAHIDKSTGPSTAALGAGLSSTSSRSSPKVDSRPSLRQHHTSSDVLTDTASVKTDYERTFTPVIARVSAHGLRLEREYHLGKAFIQTSDPDCNHTVRLIGLTRLPKRQSDAGPLAVEIFESPGRNYLRDLTDFGPAWYVSKQQVVRDTESSTSRYSPESQGKISLSTFLDFAIGASECLELLHYGLKVVHGELRADAFHFNRDTGVVRWINFGSGPRSFEHAGGLTSAGWSALSRQTGIKNRLMFIAPEQTGRMVAEPDYRTDIYSLGILFWTMLAGEPAYDGLTAMDIMQAVLGKRIPPISNLRLDVPDVLSSIIQRMTQKQIDDRYHSASGLKHDLVELKRLLGEGDAEGLVNFQIGSKDVSSSFVLPPLLLGRSQERRKIVQAMERVASKQQVLHPADGKRMNSITSATTSSLSDRNDAMEGATRSSDVSSQETKDADAGARFDSLSSLNAHERRMSRNDVDKAEVPINIEKPPLETRSSRESAEMTFTADSQASSNMRNPYRSKALSNAASRGAAKQRYSHRRRCQVITVCGQAGLGKSSLIQSTQSEIRKLGYFASAKFDPARKVPFETMLRAMGSLFRQIFSESDIQTPYHKHNLVSIEASAAARPSSLSQAVKKAVQPETGDTASSSTAHSGSRAGSQAMAEQFLRGGTSNHSSKLSSMFLEVMRIFATSRLICLSFDDVQFADEESIDLICNILSRKLGLVIMLTCREAEQIPKAIKSILDSADANLTIITLRPLTEAEVVDYVATTLSRPHAYVKSLAVESFLLETDAREFESDTYGDQLNTSFTLKRLQDLPPASRAILAWGSLIGNTFSFPLIQRLLNGEFDRIGDVSSATKPGCAKIEPCFSPQLADAAVEGLQAAMQACILMPTDDENIFSFSHDRYVQASASLRECYDPEKMHFYIAQTLIEHFSIDPRSLHTRAQHICQAAKLIKETVQHRSRYRRVLSQAAQRAIESGARPTALQYYNVYLNLMQPQPWKEGPDVDYEETLDVFTRAAELYWHQGHAETAMRLTSQALEATHRASDRVPLWIITSRLLSQQGDIAGAFQALKTSMIELGVEWERSFTVEELDFNFDQLKKRVQDAHASETLIKPLVQDHEHATLGTVLTEAISAAFWSDATMASTLT
ncbi:MAG: hypothetical protein Q9196_000842 [Gyalolechia fulgens]